MITLIKKLFHLHQYETFGYLGIATITTGTQCKKCGHILHSSCMRVK